MNAEHKSVPRGSGRPTAQTALKSWIRRQFRAWPIIRHLCAERDNLQRINEHLLANHVANSQVNKHLLADQAKIKADNEWLLAEQSAIRALNDYLEREQDWLKTANQRLQAEFQETKQLTPLGRSEKKDQPMAPGMISNFDIEAITDLAKKFLPVE